MEKVLRCNEMFSASILDRTSQLQENVQKVDALSDIERYIKRKRKNDVRSRKKREEFKPYETKPLEMKRRQMGSFVGAGDDSFLMVNDDHREAVDLKKPEEEKEHLKKVFNSLVYESEPTLEDDVLNATKMLCEARNRIHFAEFIGLVNSARQLPN